MKRYVEALSKELCLRENFFSESSLDTLYLGGGTPSLLPADLLEGIIRAVNRHFSFNPQAEITLEANPDDINDEKLQCWKNLGFNRLSIGIQSFNDRLLRLVNRRHSSKQAIEAVRLAQAYGFRNISIDLMYGLPGQSINDWKHDIEQALQLDVQHISAYGLSYEEGTVLYRRWQSGDIRQADDELYNEMSDCLCQLLRQAQFERYEVSNFALPGYRSRHNSSYWHDVPYMGIGPGAHSYNGHSRQWNVEDLHQYIDLLSQGQLPQEEEVLDRTMRYNEMLMLSLRTVEGVDLSLLERRFGAEALRDCLHKALPSIEKGLLQLAGNHLVPTQMGFKWLNTIIEDLMWDV